MWLLTLLLAVFSGILLYLWIKSAHSYWRNKNIPFIKPVVLFGSMLPVIRGKKSFAELLHDQYLELKRSGLGYGGIFEFTSPTIMITDPDLIREVTVKSFDHFAERRTPDIGDDADPLFHRSLSSLKSDEWKQMRSILSPAFTASKLKAMFPLLTKCCVNFTHALEKEANNAAPVEMSKLFTRMASDVIGSVAFGHESHAVLSDKDEFFVMGQRLKNFSGLRYLIVAGYMLVPKLMRFLGISFTPKDISVYFRHLIVGTMEHRDKLNISRPDMLQLLMAAQKGGIKRLEGDEDYSGTIGEDDNASAVHKKHIGEVETKKSFTNEDIAAQAFVFFLAGYDTVSSLLSFASHLLACNPDIQETLHQEVADAGEISYEAVKDMKYLEMVISETLRLYPPAVFSDRRCTQNFKFPDRDFVMEKGQGIIYPIYALQRDPEFFPNPDKFNPERFSVEGKQNIRPYTYLPFGSGPHNCIGMRFALLEAKVCLAHVLQSFELRVCSKTEVPLKLSTKSFQMTTDKGFWLSLHKRKTLLVK